MQISQGMIVNIARDRHKTSITSALSSTVVHKWSYGDFILQMSLIIIH